MKRRTWKKKMARRIAYEHKLFRFRLGDHRSIYLTKDYRRIALLELAEMKTAEWRAAAERRTVSGGYLPERP